MDKYVEAAAAACKDALSRREVQVALASVAAAAVALWGASAVHRMLTAPPAEEPLTRLHNTRAGLTPQEAALEKDFIAKDKISVTFGDIGGLERQIAEIEELVLLPLSHAHLYAHSRIAQQPTGILLYGPPGTGKTMLAKAIAKSAAASFLTVNVASRTSVWVQSVWRCA
jgi:SpoVK/Ycf46/Vps4 family AAA+-type ATPase